MGLSRTLALRGGLLRAAGPFFESTTFGVFLAISTVCTAAMRSLFRSRVAHMAAVGIGLVGCFATISRNAWIGVLIGLIVVAMYRGRVGKAAAAGGLAVLGAITLIVVAPNSGTVASLLGKGDTTAASTATYRQELFSKSIPLIKSSPWIGTPFDRVRSLVQSELHSGKLSVDYVNSYLYFIVTTGVLGLLVFLFFLLVPISRLLSLRRKAFRLVDDAETFTALFSAQIALAFMLIGTSFAERIPVFAILLIGMTRQAIARLGRIETPRVAAVHIKSAPESAAIDLETPEQRAPAQTANATP
jgi:O-antigen ligase